MTEPGAGPFRILLVEDNELNRALVRAILTRTTEPRLRDLDLVEAADLAGAMETLADGTRLDLILLDVHLPDGSGLAVARQVAARRADHPAGRPAVMALTAAAMPREQAAAIEAGCDTFLAKPYTSAELIQTMLKLLPG